MSLEAIHHRSVRIPRMLRVTEGIDNVVRALAELAGEGCAMLVVHSGDQSPTGYGRQLARASTDYGLRVTEALAKSNTNQWAHSVARLIREASPDYVVAVGGGRVLDAAKVAAAREAVDLISIPTQAASDGICSPVAVMEDETGRLRSLGARIPAGIVVDMTILGGAPRQTWLSGLGDLISNLSAVKDWQLAHELFGEPIDDFACLTSEAAARSVYTEHPDVSDPEFRRRLVMGLILSGIAMEMAGSSRPASGSEHLISHALDRLLVAPRLHGLQVAAGTVAASILRREAPSPLITFFRAAGLPVTPADLGIETAVFMDAIRHGPEQRPGRKTILDVADDRQLADLESLYDGRGL